MAYLDFITGIFGSVSQLLDSVTKAKDLRLGKAGIRNMVLVELELNISLLADDYLRNRLSEKDVISNLSCTQIIKAMESNFDFSEIRKGKLKRDKLPEGDYIRKLEGFTAEQLFRKIHVKILELKRVETLYKDKDMNALRLGVRLKNLVKLLMVTATFIGNKN